VLSQFFSENLETLSVVHKRLCKFGDVPESWIVSSRNRNELESKKKSG